MSEIAAGSVVQANGEDFLRKVTEVRGAKAYCERLPKGNGKWIPIAELRLENPSGPLRFLFS